MTRIDGFFAAGSVGIMGELGSIFGRKCPTDAQNKSAHLDQSEHVALQASDRIESDLTQDGRQARCQLCR